jgi:hypothetical protein
MDVAKHCFGSRHEASFSHSEEKPAAAHKALVNISENTRARLAAMRRIEDETGRSA